MTEKRKTRAELEAALADSDARLEARALELAQARKSAAEVLDTNRAFRKAIDDLKERLASTEAENQRMRGYLARVQEDDVVREELIHVGDPGGEMRLVPKRKPTVFHAGNFGGLGGINREDGIWQNGCMGLTDREARPKHWVTY